ncbi:hypothetical protein B566_EDAN006648 [Ephemera danica]|nr:hypothetical protein B566_EDAN006648 [Ephemera danica]
MWCRSAFKLLEINEKHHILSPGMFVVDCGAAPGSWTQVLVKECNSRGQDTTKPKGTVIAVDINNIVALEGATIFEKHDFTLPETQQKIQTLMEQHGGAHAVVSDMAPLASGVKHLDHEVIVNLCYIALRFSLSISRPGATFLAKLWDGRLAPALQADISKFYSNVKAVKPNASRSDSAEFFLLAKDFKGLKPR